MNESQISVTQMSHTHAFSKTDGYLQVTTARVLFTKKADLGSGVHWAHSLLDVQNVELKDLLGGHELVLHVRAGGSLRKISLRQGILGGRHDNMQALANLIMQQKRDLATAATRPAPGMGAGPNLATELEKLANLRRQGILSEVEFEQAKARLLRG